MHYLVTVLQLLVASMGKEFSNFITKCAKLFISDKDPIEQPLFSAMSIFATFVPSPLFIPLLSN